MVGEGEGGGNVHWIDFRFECGAQRNVMGWNRPGILITGGTGSFGNKFVERVLTKYNPHRLIVFSRDELKQFEMRQRFPDKAGSRMRSFIGEVKGPQRLRRAVATCSMGPGEH